MCGSEAEDRRRCYRGAGRGRARKGLGQSLSRWTHVACCPLGPRRCRWRRPRIGVTASEPGQQAPDANPMIFLASSCAWRPGRPTPRDGGPPAPAPHRLIPQIRKRECAPAYDRANRRASCGSGHRCQRRATPGSAARKRAHQPRLPSPIRIRGKRRAQPRMPPR